MIKILTPWKRTVSDTWRTRNMMGIISHLDSTLSSLNAELRLYPNAVKLHQFSVCWALYALWLWGHRFSLPFLYFPTSIISGTECLMSCYMLCTWKYLNRAFSKHIFVWRVTSVWQEDQALLAHLELVSQDLRYVYFSFGVREAGQKGKIISASLLKRIYVC